MKFSCPYCDGHIEAAEDQTGQTVDCPHCSRQIFLSTGVSADAPPIVIPPPVIPQTKRSFFSVLTSWPGALLASFGFVFLLLVIIGAHNLFFSSAPDSPPYLVVTQSIIPNGGYYWVVAIDSQYRNEPDMRRLAARLRYDTRHDRNAIIWIYDNQTAASMRDDAIANRLGQQDMQHHDSHFIGSYIRNANTGFNAITIKLDGTQGSLKVIPL